LMMSLWDALRMNMMISYQELVRTFPNIKIGRNDGAYIHWRLGNYLVIQNNTVLYICLVL
ncbi:hypothetical protein AB2894_24125, partial [Escherichia coli]